MNKVIIMGRLTKDPETRTTGSGTTVTSFSVAVDRRFKGQNGEKQTDFFNVTAWRQLGDICGKYLAKGRQVLVEGSLQNRTYEDKNGVKKYATDIVADNVEFVGNRGDSSGNAPAPAQQQGAFTEVEDEDLPF